VAADNEESSNMPISKPLNPVAGAGLFGHHPQAARQAGRALMARGRCPPDRLKQKVFNMDLMPVKNACIHRHRIKPETRAGESLRVCCLKVALCLAGCADSNPLEFSDRSVD
jgi:hypothetical protein